MTREQKIARDIHKILTGFNQQEGVYWGEHLRVAEYILSREKQLLEKIGKPLRELQAMVKGECPSLLNEDGGGNARLDMEIDEALVIIEKEIKDSLEYPEVKIQPVKQWSGEN